MNEELKTTLARIRPAALAVAGYDRAEMRLAMRWGRKNKAAVILMSETKWDDKRRLFWKRWLQSLIVQDVDAALVSGAAAGEYLVSLGMSRERVFRHYGAVDNDLFSRVAAESRHSGLKAAGMPNRPYFIACSRMIEWRKNLRRLLLAYQEYRIDCPDPWPLVLCGDGPDRVGYERFVKDRQIEGVVFAGFRQVDDLARCYAHAGAFVHPATHEPWGLVVNEAMASGLPILVSRRVGAAYDLMREGENGFQFDPYDTRDMAQSMREIGTLSETKRSAMGALSQRIIANWGPERFGKGLLEALEGIQSRGAGRDKTRMPRDDESLARG